MLLAGDLNATPWSPWFQRLLADSRLLNSSQGRGLFASWPAQLWPLRIPLDHCLISPGLHVTAKTMGPRVGSDHLPVIVDLAVPATSETDFKP